MTRSSRPWVSCSCVCAAVIVRLLFMAVPVHAQQATGKWEVEFHAGGGPVNNPTDGTASLPAAGPPFTTVVGTPSRRTSSWYVGDGTVLLNQVNAALGITSRITPLDQVFARSLADRERGATYGVRVSGAISRRFSAELTVDYASDQVTMSAPALTGIEAARASFVPAWTALIASGPFTGTTVTSVSTIRDGEKRRTFTTTGALNISLKTSGKIVPYRLPRGRLRHQHRFDSERIARGQLQVSGPGLLCSERGR